MSVLPDPSAPILPPTPEERLPENWIELPSSRRAEIAEWDARDAQQKAHQAMLARCATPYITPKEPLPELEGAPDPPPKDFGPPLTSHGWLGGDGQRYPQHQDDPTGVAGRYWYRAGQARGQANAQREAVHGPSVAKYQAAQAVHQRIVPPWYAAEKGLTQTPEEIRQWQEAQDVITRYHVARKRGPGRRQDASRQLWTPAEDRYIQEHYPTEDPREIAKTLGRTYAAVRGRAMLLGVRSERIQPSKSTWTEEMDTIIRENYPTKGGFWVAQRLNRTLPAVRYRAQCLGVKAAPGRRKKEFAPTSAAPPLPFKPFTPAEDQAIRAAKALGYDALVALPAQLGRTSPEVLARMKELGLHGA